MMWKKHVRGLIGTASAAVAVTAAILLAPASLGRGPAPAPAVGTCTELASRVDARQVPIDTGFDPERNLVLAHHEGRTYAMRPDDPACRAIAPIRALIDDMMQADRENVAEACASARAVLHSGKATDHGRPVDRAALQRFVDRRCA